MTDNGWRPIEEAPTHVPVLLYWPRSPMGSTVVIAWYRRGLWHFKNHCAWGSTVRGEPTHFMPLPAPPEK